MEIITGGFVKLYCKVDKKGKKLDVPETRILHPIDARGLIEATKNMEDPLYSYFPFVDENDEEKVIEEVVKEKNKKDKKDKKKKSEEIVPVSSILEGDK